MDTETKSKKFNFGTLLRLREWEKVKERGTQCGSFTLDPETGTLYFYNPDLVEHKITIPLGKGTKNHRLAELLVAKNGLTVTYKDFYEHVFMPNRYEDATEPERQAQFAIRDFKTVLVKKLKARTLVNKMFENSHNSGYTLKCV